MRQNRTIPQHQTNQLFTQKFVFSDFSLVSISAFLYNGLSNMDLQRVSSPQVNFGYYLTPACTNTKNVKILEYHNMSSDPNRMSQHLLEIL